MSELDQFSSDLVKKYSGQVPGVKTPDIDEFSHQLIQQGLKAAPGGVISEEGGLHLDPTKDWGFARELFDSAVDGKYSDFAGEHFQKAKAAWAKENGGQAVLAKAIGETVPALALSAITGQGELALARLAQVPKLGEFLTGTAEGNALMRTASQATWGAQQGAISAGYNRALGQDDSVAGGAAVGAVAGPLTSKLFVGSVTPSVRKLAEAWRKEGMSLSTAQLPGAPLLVKAYSKLFGLGNKDIPALTKSLMRSTGSNEELLNAETLKTARQDIKQRLDQAFPGSNIKTLADDEVTSLLEKLQPMLRGNSPQVQAAKLAGNQWTNANVLDKMRTPATEISGMVDPSRVLGAVQSRAASYPGGLDASDAATAAGNPVNLGVLGRGAQAFTRTPMGNLLEQHPLATVGAAGLAPEVMTHLAPYAESYLTNPSAIATGGLLAGLGPVLNSQTYMKMLLGGATPNALIPALQRTYGNNLGTSAVDALGAFNPVTAAKGAPADATESYIRQAASARGIDPDVAVKVAKTEGLGGGYAGDQGSSFGPFQLHYGNVAKGQNAVSGLGDLFTKQTGLHASDPKTVPQQVDFALDYAARNGWSPWHGWTGDEFAGITKSARRITIPLSAANVAPNIAPDVNALSQALGAPVGQGGVSSNELTGSP
jgi:hypothetical protein